MFQCLMIYIYFKPLSSLSVDYVLNGILFVQIHLMIKSNSIFSLLHLSFQCYNKDALLDQVCSNTQYGCTTFNTKVLMKIWNMDALQVSTGFLGSSLKYVKKVQISFQEIYQESPNIFLDYP